MKYSFRREIPFVKEKDESDKSSESERKEDVVDPVKHQNHFFSVVGLLDGELGAVESFHVAEGLDPELDGRSVSIDSIRNLKRRGSSSTVTVSSLNRFTICI